MEIGENETDMVCGHVSDSKKITEQLQKYSDAKLAMAAEREKELLEKPLFITRLLSCFKGR